MTERRSRFARRPRPDALVFTARDAAILLVCFEHRWLTRPQLQRLAGVPGVTRMNQRLRQLYDHGYLDRLRAGTVGAGLQPVYLAGPSAVPLLARETGLPASEIRERLREDARAGPVLLPHDLEVNEVRIALAEGIGRHQGLRLDLWLNARESFDAYTPGRALRPDGYFRFWHGDILHACFLEVDRGTANLTRWKEKAARYREYREGGFYVARYELQRFRVLATAPTLPRLEHLRAATAAITERGFWFALTGEVVADPNPARALWWTVGGSGRRALIEP